MSCCCRYCCSPSQRRKLLSDQFSRLLSAHTAYIKAGSSSYDIKHYYFEQLARYNDMLDSLVY